MQRRVGLVLVLSLLSLTVVVAQDKAGKSKDKQEEQPGELVTKKTGRPGELTREEEDEIDKIVDNFILFDTGRSRNQKFNKDFQKLGVEGIPGLVRGLNKSAELSHSCPVSLISKKLLELMQLTDDPRTLEFIRENVGAGVKRTPYQGILNNLKVATMLRKAEVERNRQILLRQRSQGSPGERSPGEGKPE